MNDTHSDIPRQCFSTSASFITIALAAVSVGAIILMGYLAVGRPVDIALLSTSPVFLILEAIAVVSGGLCVLTAGVGCMAYAAQE